VGDEGRWVAKRRGECALGKKVRKKRYAHLKLAARAIITRKREVY